MILCIFDILDGEKSGMLSRFSDVVKNIKFGRANINYYFLTSFEDMYSEILKENYISIFVFTFNKQKWLTSEFSYAFFPIQIKLPKSSTDPNCIKEIRTNIQNLNKIYSRMKTIMKFKNDFSGALFLPPKNAIIDNNILFLDYVESYIDTIKNYNRFNRHKFVKEYFYSVKGHANYFCKGIQFKPAAGHGEVSYNNPCIEVFNKYRLGLGIDPSYHYDLICGEQFEIFCRNSNVWSQAYNHANIHIGDVQRK
jgi:hypothetical protein